MSELVSMFGSMIAIPVTVYSILYIQHHYQTLNDESTSDDEKTYEFCMQIIDPEAPAKVYNEAYVPPQYRVVVEQATDGSYQYRKLNDVVEYHSDDTDDT